MEKSMRSIRILPLLLFLMGLLVVAYLFFSEAGKNPLGSNSRAASTSNMTLVGEVEKLPNCLDSFICYDLVEERTKIRYHLYSKRFPALLKKDLCLDREKCETNNYSQINLEDYEGIKVKIKGLYLSQKISYLIITDIEVENNNGN